MSEATSLKNISTFNLMVELLYQGSAQIISEIEDMEPFDVEELIFELKFRSGQDFKEDVESWCMWFLSDCKDIDNETRTTFSMLKRNKEQTDYYVERLTKKGS